MGTPAESIETRRQLIEAAGRLFANKGFHGVSVRDIVAASGTHLSSINYHFRDKSGLYRACIEAAFSLPRFEKIKLSAFQTREPKKLLRQVITALIGDFHDSPVDTWQARMYFRLLVDRSDEFDWFEQLAKPKFTMIRAVVGGAAADDADAAHIDLATFFLIGLLDEITSAHSLLHRAAPAMAKAMKREDWLVDSVYESTLAILKVGRR